MAAPTNGKTPGVCGAKGLQETHQQAPIVGEALSSYKPFANLRAAFAMKNHEFYRSIGEDGSITYFCRKWGMERALPDLDAARAFLVQIGGAL